jgi:hypothetical protein
VRPVPIVILASCAHLLLGCGASSASLVAAPSAGALGGGALVEVTSDPASPQPVPAFDGIQDSERFIEFGFTADETRVVLCHGWRGVRDGSPVKRWCDIDTIGSMTTAEVLVTPDGFDDARSPGGDPDMRAKLAAIGYPASPGRWPYADLVVVMRRVVSTEYTERVAVFFREQTTGVEHRAGEVLAETGQDHVYPRAAVLSPKGTLLTLVASESDGKSIRLEHATIDANMVAARTYDEAAAKARSPQQAEMLRAKAQAAEARSPAR